MTNWLESRTVHAKHRQSVREVDTIPRPREEAAGRRGDPAALNVVLDCFILADLQRGELSYLCHNHHRFREVASRRLNK